MAENGVALGIQGLGMLTDQFNRMREDKQKQKEAEQGEFSLKTIAQEMRANPTAFGIDPENAPIAAKFVESIGGSHFGQMLNVLAPKVLTSQAPSSARESILRGLNWKAQGERTGDENLLKRGTELLTIGLDAITQEVTAEGKAKLPFQRMRGGRGGSGGNGFGFKFYSQISKINQEIYKSEQALTSPNLPASQKALLQKNVQALRDQVQALELRNQASIISSTQKINKDADEDESIIDALAND